MKSQKLNELTPYLSELLSSIEVSTEDSRDGEFPFFESDGTFGYLPRRAFSTYNKFLNELERVPPFDRYVSLDFTQRWISGLILKKDSLLSDIPSIESELQKFEQLAWESQKQWFVYIQIYGLEWQATAPLVFGAHEFTYLSEEALGSLNSLIDSVDLDRNAVERRHQRRKFKSLYVGTQSHYVGVGPSLKVCVESEMGKAPDLAKVEADKLLAILNFYLNYDHAPYSKLLADVKPASTSTWLNYPVVAPDSSAGSWVSEFRGGRELTVVDDSMTARMRERGLSTIQNIYSKKQMSRFDQMLLNAIHWFHVSLFENAKENQFLNLMQVFESFLSPQVGISQTSHISEGVALLLGSDFENRMEIRARMKHLYAIRSKIAHGELPSDEEMGWLNTCRGICHRLIRKMLTNEGSWSSFKDISDYIDRLKFTTES